MAVCTYGSGRVGASWTPAALTELSVNSDQRRLTDHANQSTGSYELALSAVVFGLLGWWLDHRLGITPVLLITFTIIGFIGAGLSLYYRYTAEIARLRAEAKTMREEGP